MLARLELISFHLALFVSASIAFVLDGLGGARVGPQAIVVLWLAFGGVFVLAASWLLRAHDAALWRAARPHGGSMLILIGHVAPAFGGWLFLEMARAHAGSGLVFLPIMAWAAVFYLIGGVMTIRRLGAAERIPLGPSDAGPA